MKTQVESSLSWSMELNDLIMLVAGSLLSTDPLQRPADAVRRARELWLEVLEEEDRYLRGKRTNEHS
jgi:hypothetical protein